MAEQSAAIPLSKGARRREQILQTAVELFGEVGYRGTSLRDIALRVGITHPGLLYHFHSKQELLSAVLARRDDSDALRFGLTKDVENPRELLRRVLQLAAHNTTAPGMIELFATLSAEATDQDHPAHDFFQQRYSMIVAAFQEIFDRLEEAGELREGVDPSGLGVSLVALMDGLQVQWLYSPEVVDVPVLLGAHINGLLTEPL
ncbi:MAG: TetR/AcrR family transcriptional regulator [Propionibacteriaceae bacterium]|nr:TetR/AcrR family transcriptional regulator [Propionibacteriaceae bacterium]